VPEAVIVNTAAKKRARKAKRSYVASPAAKRGGSNGEKSALANVIERALLEDENGCRVELLPSAPYGPDRVGTFAKR
jgi:hypothetical protein